MTEKELRKRYDRLIGEIGSMRMYDGRGKGVDVYRCKECGGVYYTRYRDKGVTPFVIKCRECEKGSMVHQDTVSEECAEREGLVVHNWVRPDFKWLDKMRKKDNMGVIDHVLNGGLMLDEETEG